MGQCRGQAGSGQWEHREPYPPERQQLLNPTAGRSGSAAARYVASVQTVHTELQGLCAPVPLDRLILAISPCLGRLALQGYSRAALRTRMWPLRQAQTHIRPTGAVINRSSQPTLSQDKRDGWEFCYSFL